MQNADWQSALPGSILVRATSPKPVIVGMESRSSPTILVWMRCGGMRDAMPTGQLQVRAPEWKIHGTSSRSHAESGTGSTLELTYFFCVNFLTCKFHSKVECHNFFWNCILCQLHLSEIKELGSHEHRILWAVYALS